MSLDDVLKEIAQRRCPLVEITGGEPLLQTDVYPLMQKLLDAGHEVLLETGGHLPTDDVPVGVVTILDVKCPGSGEAGRTHWANLDRLSPRDEVKFVISDRVDFDYACEVVARYDVASRVRAVLFSPVHGVLSPDELARWILETGASARLQIQIHKYVWDPAARGV
jgi:7-carboxy-7-deazaguanine synthase